MFFSILETNFHICIDIGYTLWYNLDIVRKEVNEMDKEQIKNLLELLEKALDDELVEKLTIVIKPKKK